MTTTSDLLKNKFIQNAKLLKEIFLSKDWTKEKYCNWLAQQYFLVQNTPRLLVAYAHALPFESGAEFNSIIHHINEERGHDLWLANDLKKLGYNISNFSPLPEGKTLLKCLYHDIEHVNPRSLFGYSLLLECLSIEGADELASIVEDKFGKGCATFLRGHASVDVGHTDEAFKTIKQFSNKDLTDIEETLNYSVQSYISIYNRIFSDKANKSAA